MYKLIIKRKGIRKPRELTTESWDDMYVWLKLYKEDDSVVRYTFIDEDGETLNKFVRYKKYYLYFTHYPQLEIEDDSYKWACDVFKMKKGKKEKVFRVFAGCSEEEVKEMIDSGIFEKRGK